jgi:hypothetical protein
MQRIIYVCLIAHLLLPLTVLAADRSILHHQRTRVLQEKEIISLTPASTKPAAEMSPSQTVTPDITYTVMLIQSRAKHRPVAHNGLAIHNAVVIRQYNPDKHTGLAAGNVIAPPQARYLYNVTVVRDPNVRTIGGNSINLGNVSHEGHAQEIVNLVDVRGNIAAPDVRVGNVTNVGDVSRIVSSLSIGEGSFNW